MEIVCDIETDAIENPKNLWFIVCKNLETRERHIFSAKNFRDFPKFASRVTCWIGHNFLSYDYPILLKFFPELDPNIKILDTLILSRLFNFIGLPNHKLETLGEAIGHPKSKFDDFSRASPELLERCIDDVEICFKYIKQWESKVKSEAFKQAIPTEHFSQFLCNLIHENGFKFNYSKAKEYHHSITYELNKLDSLIHKEFKPRSKLIREITPIATKANTINRKDFRWTNDLTPYTIGAPFSYISFEPFNPGSPKQLVERLNEAGWRPIDKTKGHVKFLRERKKDPEKLARYKIYGWQVNEVNLTTLPKDAPEAAQKLKQRLLLAGRLSTLEEWFAAYNPSTGRIHPYLNGIGAWTQRKSHFGPNSANIVRPGSYYGKQFRQLWTVDKNKELIGCDAKGIQLRIFGHIIQDDKFIKAVLTGDPHLLNQEALGPVCKTRDDAKTFIYAFLLGAGIPRIADILKCSLEEARIAKENFLTSYPYLLYLKNEVIPTDARRGYFIGFDGRHVPCISEHLMLAGYLQNGESIIMKMANERWYKQLTKEKIPFWQVNDVHDEWQTETIKSKKSHIAHYIGQVQSESLRKVGEELGLLCPMDGEYKIGTNWYETH